MGNTLYLFISVLLSAGRNITSKKTAIFTNKKASFFLSQTILFGSAALLLLFLGIKSAVGMEKSTLLFGLIYGTLLILSQWMFTVALRSGNTSVCSVVYSLGFILPTLSGSLFWDEAFNSLQWIGVSVSVVIILLTAKKGKKEKKKNSKSFVSYILIAMLSSGGLGIMQKVQQSSEAANEKGAFLLVAFSFAFCCSLAAFFFTFEKTAFNVQTFFYPTVTGLCFGGANFCNTALAGKMKSAVFFPLQNISTILFTTLFGIVVFREKLTPKTTVILILGIAVIVLFSV